MGWTYNLHEALRRLGIKDPRAPELLESHVMQALLVGDVSDLAPPVLAPMAWAGRQVTAVGGEYGAAQVYARGAGGCRVRQVWCGRAGVGAMAFRIDATDPLSADPVATVATNYDMGPYPVKSVVRLGTTVVVPAADMPCVAATANITQMIPDGFFIPPGSVLTVINRDHSNTLFFAALMQDVVSQAGSV